MVRLLYVSVSTLSHLNAISEVAAIVETAIEKNARLGVTGALIYTGAHFAQALEGEEGPIEELMQSIRADPRHRSILEVHRDGLTDRRFATWAMAYRGQASYVDQPIEKLLTVQSEAEKSRAIARVYAIMTEFVT